MDTPLRALGKRAPVQKKSVSFGQFVPGMPSYPVIDAVPPFNYPMDGNDRVGDCVVAGYDHSEETFSGLLDGHPTNFTLDQIYQFYKTQNPDFDPNSSTHGPGSQADGGMDIQTFLEWLVANKHILAFGHISWQSEQEMKAAIYLGLSVMIGVQLQQAQLGQQFVDGLWDYVPGSPNEGGHCINIIGYDQDYYYAVSWGKVVKLTKQFISQLCDEAWFILTERHITHANFRDNFDLAGFAAAVHVLTEGKVTITVPPAPVPPPAPPVPVCPVPTPPPAPVPPAPVPPTVVPADVLYNAAKNSLGKHMTLDPSIPQEVGCAEAVSAVLASIGISDGTKGIASTAQLFKWLKNDKRFTPILAPERGAIIVSPTGYGNGKMLGHTGILGGYSVQYPNDWGILSNNSNNGLFQEVWSWKKWIAYYKQTGGLPIYLFKLISMNPTSTPPKFGILTSSVDSNSLSLTVTGLIAAFASLVVMAAAHYNVNLPYDQVVGVVSAGATTVSGILALIGIIRKPVVSAVSS